MLSRAKNEKKHIKCNIKHAFLTWEFNKHTAPHLIPSCILWPLDLLLFSVNRHSANVTCHVYRMPRWMRSMRKCLIELKATCHQILRSTHCAFSLEVRIGIRQFVGAFDHSLDSCCCYIPGQKFPRISEVCGKSFSKNWKSAWVKHYTGQLECSVWGLSGKW